MAKVVCMALLASALLGVAAAAGLSPSWLAEDDACLAGGENCGLTALQISSRSFAAQNAEVQAAAVHQEGPAANHSGSSNATGEQFPNIDIGGAVRGAAASVQSAAAQAADSLQEAAGSLQVPDLSGIIDTLSSQAKKVVSNGSDLIGNVIDQATEAAEKANITVPGLNSDEVKRVAKTLTDQITQAEGIAQGLNTQSTEQVRQKVAEIVEGLNDTIIDTLDDAEEAARFAAESVAASMNKTFSELTPLAQRDILEVVADVTVRAEKETETTPAVAVRSGAAHFAVPAALTSLLLGAAALAA